MSQNRHGMLTSSEDSRRSRISICSGGELTSEGDDDTTEEVSSNANSNDETANPTTTNNNEQDEGRQQNVTSSQETAGPTGLTTNISGDSRRSPSAHLTTVMNGDNKKNHNGSGGVNEGSHGALKWKEYTLEESGKKMRISVQNGEAANPRFNEEMRSGDYFERLTMDLQEEFKQPQVGPTEWEGVRLRKFGKRAQEELEAVYGRAAKLKKARNGDGGMEECNLKQIRLANAKADGYLSDEACFYSVYSKLPTAWRDGVRTIPRARTTVNWHLSEEYREVKRREQEDEEKRLRRTRVRKMRERKKRKEQEVARRRREDRVDKRIKEAVGMDKIALDLPQGLNAPYSPTLRSINEDDRISEDEPHSKNEEGNGHCTVSKEVERAIKRKKKRKKKKKMKKGGSSEDLSESESEDSSEDEEEDGPPPLTGRMPRESELKETKGCMTVTQEAVATATNAPARLHHSGTRKVERARKALHQNGFGRKGKDSPEIFKTLKMAFGGNPAFAK